MEAAMSLPEVVSREEWLVARKNLLAQEKEMTRKRDALNADRRRLPMVRIDKEYFFEGRDGTTSLPDLFDGCSQLIVQHVMYGPDWEKACPGCTASLDELAPARLKHLKSRDTAFVGISRAPYSKINSYATERGWSFPWYSSFGSEFNYDFGVTFDQSRGYVQYNYRDIPERVGSDPAPAGDESGEVPGFSSFLRVGDDVFHTYSTYARGTEMVDGGTYYLLDMTALGRQEEWEEPKGRVSANAKPADPSFTS